MRGDFTLDEVFAAIDRIVRDPRYERGFALLSDHTEIGEPLTPAQAEKMLDHVERLEGAPMTGMRWAAVTRKAASYGMLRMVSVLARRIPIELRVFDSHAEAEEWLFRGEEPDVGVAGG